MLAIAVDFNHLCNGSLFSFNSCWHIIYMCVGLYICVLVDAVVQKYHYHSENTAQGFIKYAVNFLQVRLHLSHARQKIAFCFALHSVCTNFAAN